MKFMTKEKQILTDLIAQTPSESQVYSLGNRLISNIIIIFVIKFQNKFQNANQQKYIIVESLQQKTL